MLNSDFEKVFSRLEPDDALKSRIMDRMEKGEMKKSTRKNIRHIAVIAACVAVAGITTAFAAGNVISYFQSEQAIELTNMESLSMYNDEVGATASNLGYTVTIDNLATDDNFMHVFYTLRNDNADTTMEDAYNLGFMCRINGQIANFGNHNEQEGYIADDNTYKGVLKLNVASLDIPETFKLEMYAEEIKKAYSEFSGNYLYQEYLNLTDEDISKLVYVSTTARKTSVETASVVKNVNKNFSIQYIDDYDNEKTGEVEISKVIFSPFGNQLVITDTCAGIGAMRVSTYAMFDENGQSLDILNTDLCGAKEGNKSYNSIEFLKADVNTKYLKLVPIKDDIKYEETIIQPIGTYPLTYKVNDYGSVIVTDIRISDGEIDIDYYKDGYSLYEPYLQLLDKNGNNCEPGGKLGCTLYTRIHHDTNSYTAQYKYDARDDKGNKIPADESVSKENLEKTFTHLGVGAYNFTLDFNNAIEIDLK